MRSAKQFEQARQDYLAANPHLTPVVAKFAKKLVSSYWARQWCLALTAHEIYGPSLAPGRSLLRKQTVFDLAEPEPQVVTATVWAGEPFDVTIRFAPLADPAAISAKIIHSSLSLSALIAGNIPADLEKVLADPTDGLLPAFGELRADCPCPDYNDVCGHVAAVLYAIAVRLDDDPQMLFRLRGVTAAQLIDAGLATADEPADAAADDEVAAMFDLDWDDQQADAPTLSATAKAPDTP